MALGFRDHQPWLSSTRFVGLLNGEAVVDGLLLLLLLLAVFRCESVVLYQASCWVNGTAWTGWYILVTGFRYVGSGRILLSSFWS